MYRERERERDIYIYIRTPAWVAVISACKISGCNASGSNICIYTDLYVYIDMYRHICV